MYGYLNKCVYIFYYYVGVKFYFWGVIINFSFGIEDYEVYYFVFKVMEEEDMVLNLYGEVFSDVDKVRII